jgi:hypothetical protein
MADEEQLRGFGAGVNKRKGGENPFSKPPMGGCMRRRRSAVLPPGMSRRPTHRDGGGLGRFGNVGQHGRQDRDTGSIPA